MIAFLSGVIVSHRPGQLFVDVQGVGYLVRTPSGMQPGPSGSPVTVHTYLAVREDAMDLYGFASESDRDTFTILLSVNGVGPKLALAAIDTLGAEGMRRAVSTEDIGALTQIPGVGRKGAQKMVLELREKLSGLPATTQAIASPETAAHLTARDEARAALASLGYSGTEVETAIAGIDGSTEDIIRTALRALAR
ncbi:Holliday junction branch migration protein RuvA [Stomatohabitans albus]|uniref:Holliday junction branch migration protein RuvA n=1 Tax=Stomatohabitans albus TaxID=3110766 RepID=UPI00300D2E59